MSDKKLTVTLTLDDSDLIALVNILLHTANEKDELRLPTDIASNARMFIEKHDMLTIRHKLK